LIIEFRKVPLQKEAINLKVDDVVLEGEFYKKNKSTVILQGKLKGSFLTPCSLCGEDFTYHLDEELNLEIVNGIAKDNENLDIIEVFDEKIDFNELILSEIENIKLDYNKCTKCKG